MTRTERRRHVADRFGDCNGLGEFRLRDLAEPEIIYQLTIPACPLTSSQSAQHGAHREPAGAGELVHWKSGPTSTSSTATWPPATSQPVSGLALGTLNILLTVVLIFVVVH
jgi:hypothetical protein